MVALSSDILCLQETKAREEQLVDEIKHPEGYYSFFASPTIKKGYSGVAIFSKIAPNKVESVMGVDHLDTEGRLLVAYFDTFVLLNIYFPNGGGGPERLAYKMEFYKEFLAFITALRKKHKNIIFCGDVNTAHTAVDLARPKENEKNTGFLPEERVWIDEVVASGYVDIWRHQHPDAVDAYTYWDMKTFARDRNVGWRIDYFFLTKELIKKVNAVDIRADFLGSDHCPIELDIEL